MLSTPNIQISQPDKFGAFTITATGAETGDARWFAIAVMAVACIDVMRESRFQGGSGSLEVQDNFLFDTPSIEFTPSPSYKGNAHKSAVEALKYAFDLFISSDDDDSPVTATFDLAGTEHAANQTQKRIQK